MMGELALRYPRNSLVVSTGAYPGAAESDASFPQIVDRVGIRATRLRTLQGLASWTWRAGRLAHRHRRRTLRHQQGASVEARDPRWDRRSADCPSPTT